MAKYAVITNTDGNFLVRQEYSDKESAIIGFDNTHAALMNDKTMAKGTIKLVDDQLDVVDGKWQDTITHEVQGEAPEEETKTTRTTKSSK